LTPKAHIAGLDDSRMTRGGVELGIVIIAHAGCADDVNDASLSGELGIVQRGSRGSEIQHRIGRGKNGQGIGGHDDPRVGLTGQSAGIEPECVGAFALDCPGKRGAIGFQNRCDEGPAHSAGCSDHRDPHVCHLIVSLALQASSPAPLTGATAWVRLEPAHQNFPVTRRSTYASRQPVGGNTDETSGFQSIGVRWCTEGQRWGIAPAGVGQCVIDELELSVLAANQPIEKHCAVCEISGGCAGNLIAIAQHPAHVLRLRAHGDRLVETHRGKRRKVLGGDRADASLWRQARPLFRRRRALRRLWDHPPL
jgi:hypothetical protein